VASSQMIIGFSEELQRSHAKEGSLGDSLFHILNQLRNFIILCCALDRNDASILGDMFYDFYEI